MKKKSIKKMVVSLSFLFAVGLLYPMQAKAYDYMCGRLADFTLPSWQGVATTGSLVKGIDDNPCRFDIDSLTGSAKHVDAYLANSNNERRSDYVTLGVGNHDVRCWGKAQYEYHATLMNSDSSWRDGYVNGSWAPDNFR